MFFQNTDDLFFREPGSLHRLFPSIGNRLTSKRGTFRGAGHRAKPYRPQTNGKAERFINILQEEWAYGFWYKTSQQRNTSLPRWLDIYNCQRPHRGINFKTPISRLIPNH
ncbi:integrase core domain-containing protein [uncultured Roseibium sp.]|uniref:integrase core domain-containing protein n=1 Tax=uncultured Roseibium sp. TaxID=1936171 RepID=UPI002625488C|nr:integrase core domain-containing protein [uncultured Roseibium sp.]